MKSSRRVIYAFYEEHVIYILPHDLFPFMTDQADIQTTLTANLHIYD